MKGPTVYRRKNSPYWYFDVTVAGKRKRVSTKRTLKAEARAVAADYRTKELDRVQFGNGVQEISVRDALFDHYLPTKLGAASYADLERSSRKVVGEYRGVEGVAPATTPFHELTTSMLRKYRQRRAAQGASPQTIDHEIKVISAAYHLLKGEFRVPNGLKFPMARPKGKPRPLLPDEEEALLADLNPSRPIEGRGGAEYVLPETARAYRQRVDNYDLAIMLLDTGARYGEIAHLTWDQIDTIDWHWLHIYRTKVDNESRLAMTNRIRQVLQRRFEERGNSYYVFPGWAANGADVPRQSTKAMRRAMAKIGVNAPHKVERFGRRDVRSLRDTFATKLRMKGMSLDRLQKLLGHATPAMTAKYGDLPLDVASTEATTILDEIA